MTRRRSICRWGFLRTGKNLDEKEVASRIKMCHVWIRHFEIKERMLCKVNAEKSDKQ